MSERMEHAHDFCIAPDHPALDGHFPGNPIVPGAVLLDEALAAAERACGAGAWQVSTAKFHRVVRPGETLCLRLALDGRSLSFAIDCAGERAASGRLVAVALPEAPHGR